MPRGNRSGPMGMGPMTGRGQGYCSGYDAPGYAYPGHHTRGMRRAWRGRGWFGTPMHRHGWGPMDFVAYEVPYPAEMSAEEQADMLTTREAWLQEQLDEVRMNLENLQKETKNKSEKSDK